MKRVLKGIAHKDEYTELVETEINSFFSDIFEPIFELLQKDARENTTLGAVRTALSKGQIWYADGKFTGEFSAAISRELRSIGATFSDGAFHISVSDMPMDLRSAVATARLQAETAHHTLLNTLNAMEANLPAAVTGLVFTKAVDKIVADLQKQFLESVAKEVDSGSLAVPSNITPEIARVMSEQLTHNTDIEIKNFTAEQIAELREKVQQNLFAGGRPDRLEGLIRTQFGVNQRKARFIAENETSLAISKFREERYKALGSTQYVWSTSHDGKVRHDHKVLDGRTFSWDTPPVVDFPSGRRRNPGEDYNCRCVALPIVNLA